MRRLPWMVTCVSALVLALAAPAHAGTAVRDATAITYQAAAGTGAAEQVAVGVENAMAF